MAREVKFRRGTTADHAVFTGLEAEITVDTTKKTAVVHDGLTPGGHPLAKSTDLPDLSNRVIGSGILKIEAILQSNYDLLSPPDPMTLYVIVPMAVELSAGTITITGFDLS